MPLLIPLAIITAYGINKIFKNRIIKVGLIVLCTIWGVVQFWVYSFPILSLQKWAIFRRLAEPNAFFCPVNEDWKLDEIIDYIRASMDDGNNVYRVHVGANLHALSPMTLSYIAAQKRLNLEFCGYNLKPEEALDCDFVIVKSGDSQGFFYPLRRAQELIHKLAKSEKFVKLPNSFILPDKSAVEIYKKILE
jgi:hypothetical protein